jgi:hypothetical protein
LLATPFAKGKPFMRAAILMLRLELAVPAAHAADGARSLVFSIGVL